MGNERNSASAAFGASRASESTSEAWLMPTHVRSHIRRVNCLPKKPILKVLHEEQEDEHEQDSSETAPASEAGDADD